MSNTKKAKPKGSVAMPGGGISIGVRYQRAVATIERQRQEMAVMQQQLSMYGDHVLYHHNGQPATCGWERDIIARIEAAQREQLESDTKEKAG